MTPNWEFLLDEQSLAAVLPAGQANFARPVRDALALFLGGLPADRQALILAAQAKLPPTASFSQRLGLLAQSCPVLQKLGQVLARDRRLPAELRTHLRELESLPPSVPLEVIQQTLADELGPLEDRGVTLQPPAIAEASVAVVIPFLQRGSPAAPPVEGVFKVLKPGIEQQLDLELGLLDQVGQQLDLRCEELQIPQLDYQESFQQVRSRLWDEVELENEQRHLGLAKKFFADEPRVLIPAVLPHCTSRVTAMERVYGAKVTGQLQTPRDQRRLAKLVARSLIAKPVFSRADQALFHSDPHAGNLFLTDDGRLAILDWSLVGRLGVSERVAIVQLLLGAVALDASRVAGVLRQLGDPQRLDDARIQRVAEDWVQRVRRGQFPGLTWLVGVLDDAVQTARLRVPVDMLLFRKSLLTLEGVVAEVGHCSGQIDRTLVLEFLRHFATEWPLRWLRPPQSRKFATRLSNLDLTRAWLNCPGAVARFWAGYAIDAVQACASRWGPAARIKSGAPPDTSGQSAPGVDDLTVDDTLAGDPLADGC